MQYAEYKRFCVYTCNYYVVRFEDQHAQADQALGQRSLGKIQSQGCSPAS